jgi:general stress protein 26
METFLARPLLARMSSLNGDGTIHLASLYYLYSGDEFLLGTQARSQRVRNIRLDPRVTLLIDSEEPVLQSVMVYGKASLDEINVIEKRVKILERYYSSTDDARSFAERLARAWKTVIIHVCLTKIITIDYSQPFSIE